MAKTIVILGGGSGGLVAANKLRKNLGKEHRIILIDKNSHHYFAPSFPWFVIGYRAEKQIKRDFNILNKKGIEYINANISEIDIGKRTIKTNIKDVSYDYLIVALGAELDLDSIPGFKEIAYSFYDFENSIKLRDNLKKFTYGNIAVVISSMPFKCPAAPYEIAILLDYYLKKKNIRDKLNINIYTPESYPMPTAGQNMGEALKYMLTERNIGFNPGLKLVSIDVNKKELNFEKDKKEKFDFLIAIPPHRVTKVVKDAGLTNEIGWVPVDTKTLKTKYDNIYAVGDIITIKLPGRYKPEVPLSLPKAGVFAHSQAEVVANNIISEINGNLGKKEFDGKGSCFIELGSGQAGFATGNFYTEPYPQIKLKKPGIIWHLGKILFEKYWLWYWF